MERLNGQGFETLVTEAQEYSRDFKERMWPLSRPLTDLERRRQQRFFSGNVLDSVRVVSHWPFVWRVDGQTLSMVTFEDLIVDFGFRKTPGQRARSFFHELVHVTQFRLLGADTFVRETLKYRQAGYNSFTMPFEAQAYGLVRRFVKGRGFDAEQEIRAGLAVLGYKL